MQERSDTGSLGPDLNSQTAAAGERSLEELFTEAEALIGRMEAPELSLEDAFAAYEQGMRILRACNSRIDQVEQKMLVMNEEGGLEPFEEDQAAPKTGI